MEISKILPNSQGGFHKQRNTVDNIIQLEAAVSNTINSGEVVIAVSIDFESDFDHVCQNLISQILKGMDFPDEVI